MVKPVQVLWTLALAVVVLLPLAGVAFGSVTDISTERSGSIIVFPKVVWDGTRDTIIQIASTSNNMVQARCFYVNGADPMQCGETDFDIWLTREQPTVWVVSMGRSDTFVAALSGGATEAVDVTGAVTDDHVGYDSGFPPGLIPPVPQGFIGELKCVQVDASDAPFRGNQLNGEATIRSLSGDVSEYNAIAFHGNPDTTLSDPRSTDPDDLPLDLTVNTASPTEVAGGNNTGMYSACPDTILLNHLTEGAPDDVVSQLGDCTPAVCIAGTTNKLGLACTVDTDCGTNGVCGGCPISTELTLVPCSENFENQTPTSLKVSFTIYNEFEQALSRSTTVDCYLNVTLSQIDPVAFGFNYQQTPGAYVRITPNYGLCSPTQGVCTTGSAIGASCTSNADCPAAGGVIGVAEEFRAATTGAGVAPRAAAAYNLQTEGNRFDAATDGNGDPVTGVTDHIIIPQP
jgi:hypothetical protein